VTTAGRHQVHFAIKLAHSVNDAFSNVIFTTEGLKVDCITFNFEANPKPTAYTKISQLVSQRSVCGSEALNISVKLMLTAKGDTAVLVKLICFSMRLKYPKAT
jgi:hypothetical protein